MFLKAGRAGKSVAPIDIWPHDEPSTSIRYRIRCKKK
jgi:hypothetical protein